MYTSVKPGIHIFRVTLNSLVRITNVVSSNLDQGKVYNNM